MIVHDRIERGKWWVKLLPTFFWLKLYSPKPCSYCTVRGETNCSIELSVCA